MADKSRFALRAMIAGALMVLAAPAFAATQKQHDDCNSDDLDRTIAGCTSVLNDRHESKRVRGIAHVGRGLAFAEKGDLDRAIADYTEAVRLNPKDALAYSNRGLTYADKGDFDRAIADYTTAIRINPLPHSDVVGVPHVNIYHNRCIAWLRKSELDRAIADCDEALRLDPGFAFAHFSRGQAWYAKYMYGSEWVDAKDLERAITDFSEAIRFDPKNEGYRRARGVAWQVNGNQDLAQIDFDEAERIVRATPLPKLHLLTQ